MKYTISLIYYEFHKLLMKPVFILLTVFVASAQLFQFYGRCQDLDWIDRDMYRKEQEEKEKLSHEEAVAKLNRDRDGLLLLGLLQSFGDSQEEREILELQWSDLAAQYGMSFSAFVREYEDAAGTAEETGHLQTVLNTLFQQYEYIDNYRSFIEELPLRAERLKEVSIFAKQKSFSNRSILKSVNDYEKLGTVEIRPDYDQGINALGSEPATVVFLLIIVLGAAVILFSEERDSGMIHMLRSTTYGHSFLAAAKWGTLALFSMCVVLIVYGGRILIAGSVLGFGDLSRSLQSVSVFRNCYYRITAGGYLALSVLLPMFTVILFTAIVSFLYVLFEKPWIAAGIIAAFVGEQYLLYRFLSDQAALNVLKFVNLFSFADTSARFADPVYINLFGYPAAVFSCCVIVFTLITAVCLAGMIFCFAKGIQLKMPVPFGFRRQVRIRGSVLLLSHEHYRLYIVAFGVLVLLMLLYLGYRKTEKKDLLLSNADYLYYSWGQEIAGEVNNKTEEWFLMKEQELNGMTDSGNSASVEHVSEAGISSEEDTTAVRMTELYLMQARSRELQEKRQVYDRINLEYQMLQVPLEKGIPVHYISEIQSDPVFADGKAYLLQALLMMVILCICYCPIFSMDEESGMGKLVHATKHGRTAVFLTRYLVMFLFYMLAFTVFILPYLYNWIHIYRMLDWDAPVQSVIRYVNCDGRMTIREFLILWFGGSLISGAGYIALMGLLSKYCRKQSTTMIVAIVVIASDFFVNLLGFPGISLGVLSSGFGSTELLTGMGHTWWLYGILGKNLLLTGGILLWHWRSYIR